LFIIYFYYNYFYYYYYYYYYIIYYFFFCGWCEKGTMETNEEHGICLECHGECNIHSQKCSVCFKSVSEDQIKHILTIRKLEPPKTEMIRDRNFVQISQLNVFVESLNLKIRKRGGSRYHEKKNTCS
jgi:hypothetical protein